MLQLLTALGAILGCCVSLLTADPSGLAEVSVFRERNIAE